MAQLGSAHAWGAWGRRFKSCHPDIFVIFKKIMSFESGLLGLFDTKKGQGIICEENILKGPYKKPTI